MPNDDDAMPFSDRSTNRARKITIGLLGLDVTPMTADEAVEWVTMTTGKRLLLNHNLHSAYLFQTAPFFRALYARADRVLIDGMPILLFASASAGKRLHSSFRIGSTDWIERLTQAQSPGRLLLFGAMEAANRDAVARLQELLGPQGWVVDGLNGYTRPDVALDWLKKQEPTLVLIGLGMPLQEQFLADYWDELPDACYATVGGAIDYVAGHQRLAPRWVGRLGAEWLWRLIHAPKRLAHRYLVEPALLIGALVTRRRHHEPSP